MNSADRRVSLRRNAHPGVSLLKTSNHDHSSLKLKTPLNSQTTIVSPSQGEAPAEPQTQPTAEHLSEAPVACQPTTEPCPQLIAIRNHPAKQLRRSPSTGSRSSPAIRGLSGIWAHRPTASSQSPRGRGVGGGFTQSHRALGRSLPACRNRWAGVRCESDARK